MPAQPARRKVADAAVVAQGVGQRGHEEFPEQVMVGWFEQERQVSTRKRMRASPGG